jgi:Asp-tRNA(Asn)/Glu-tRNA(Gln) amidotransferase A subunit family amidase
MPVADLMDSLRSSEPTLPEFIAQVEARFLEREQFISAFLAEEGRFDRLRREADDLLARYPEEIARPPLFGVMVGIKDIFRADGFPTRAGSRLPAEEFAGPEAKSVSRLKEAGALILGKTVTTEFAYFAPGPTRNPRNPEHTPGGSSSGSAAAVAAGLCTLALGSQTIGSIIRPAAFCGVVGLKPTYERIPSYGVIPLSPSLDHVGFFTQDVMAARWAAPVLYDAWNGTTSAETKPSLGIPEGPYLDYVSPEGRASFEQTSSLLRDRGYVIRPVSVMPDFEAVSTRHHVIVAAEAAQVHESWFVKHAQLYASKTGALIREGQSITASELQAAREGREHLREELTHAMDANSLDLWIAPSAPGPAPRGLDSTGDPVMNLPWTHAGLPALSLPSGFAESGLPFGLQIIGRWGQDEALLAQAAHIEAALRPA